MIIILKKYKELLTRWLVMVGMKFILSRTKLKVKIIKQKEKTDGC